MKLRGYDLIGEAKALYDQALFPIPLYYKSKVPAVRWRRWYENYPSWKDVAEVFSTKLYRGIGVLVGKVSHNLVVLDFDQPHRYAQWHTKHPIITRTVRTNRGLHVYVRLTNPPKRTLSMEGGDIKGNGYVVTPPSIHPSGWQYFYRNLYAPIYTADSLTSIGIVVDVPVRNIPAGLIPPRDKGTTKNVLVSNIKKLLPIPQLLHTHTELFPSGENYLICCCPLHDDHSPSMWVNVERGICGCFSSTCIGHEHPMDVINLYAKLSNISNREAIFALAERLGLI